MRIKYKKLHEEAKAPTQSREGDAAWDIVALNKTLREKYIEYGTGIAIAIPEDHVGLLFPRSSVSNYDQTLANCVGVIDHNYRGEIKFRFKNLEHNKQGSSFLDYSAGEKIGQLIIIPRPFLEFEEVEELDQTNRNEQGFGSSGK